MQATENLNIVSFDPMPTPQEIHQRVPLTENAAKSVLAGRRSLEAILDRRDKRRFVVVGPCSIHDPVAGIDYARRLKAPALLLFPQLHLRKRVAGQQPPLVRAHAAKNIPAFGQADTGISLHPFFVQQTAIGRFLVDE